MAALVAIGCGLDLVSLPSVDDSSFERLNGVAFGMRAADLGDVRPDVEGSPEGYYREGYLSGWIVYGFDLDMIESAWDALFNGAPGPGGNSLVMSLASGPLRTPRPTSRLGGVAWILESEGDEWLPGRWQELSTKVNAAKIAVPKCTESNHTRYQIKQMTWPGLPTVRMTLEIVGADDGQGASTRLVVMSQLKPFAPAGAPFQDVVCDS